MSLVAVGVLLMTDLMLCVSPARIVHGCAPVQRKSLFINVALSKPDYKSSVIDYYASSNSSKSPQTDRIRAGRIF